MNTTCPRCGSPRDTTSRFCTNCGAVLDTEGQGGYSAQPQSAPYVQSWAQPSAQQQVPPWATSNPGAGYSQQQTLGAQANSSGGGGFGFNSQNDALLKKVLTAVVALVLGTIVLLLLFGTLAYFVPGLRCAFLIVILLLVLIPWIIYVKIRSYVRRTVGRSIWWFM